MINNMFLNIPENKNTMFLDDLIFEIEYNFFDSVSIFFNNTKIDFLSNVWDFNYLYGGKDDPERKIVFKDTFPEIKEILKLFAIYSIFENIKPNTIEEKVTVVRKWYEDFKIKDNTFSINNVDIYAIEKYYKDDFKIKPETTFHKMRVVHDFLSFYEEYIDGNVDYDTELLFILSKYKRTFQAIEEAKTPNIKNDVYGVITYKLYEFMKDDTQTYNDRAIAALTVLISQTGIRASDAAYLKNDSKTKVVIDSNNVLNFLYFDKHKGTRGMSTPQKQKVFITPMGIEAFDMLLKLKEEHNIDVEFLYVYKKGDKYRYTNSSLIRNKYFRLVVKEFGKIFKTENNDNDVKYDIVTKSYYHIPNLHQFRVYYVNYLYDKGVPRPLMPLFLGSTIYDDTHYFRPKYNIAIDGKLMHDFICDLNNNEVLRPIEIDDNVEESIEYDIKKFLKDSKYNIKNLTPKMIENMLKSFYIIVKHGGFCVRPIDSYCKNDDFSNVDLCCNYSCQHFFIMYHNILDYYLEYHEIKELIETSKKNNFELMYKKNSEHMAFKVEKRILPLIEALRNKINNKGFEDIEIKNKLLLKIIKNLDEFENEVKHWIIQKK